MDRYQAYAGYRDSRLEWLGELPEHWKVKRLGHFFEERREKVSDKDYSALSVTKHGIVPQLETAAKTDAGDNRKLVLKNDFVINSRSDRKGSSGVSPLDGSVSLISIVMTPRKIKPNYVHHLLRSYCFQEEFYRYGKGIVADLWSTNSSELKNILMPDIPADEQDKIANFLDHETAKIDTLIEKQQQLVKLLIEKRQAVISHAVTKGLNPNAKIKDSGIDWLSEVPEHWDVTRVGWMCEFISYGFTNPMPATDDGPYLLTAADIEFGGVNYEKARHTSKVAFSTLLSPKSRPEKGDVLITKDGTLGRVSVFRGEHKACISQSVALLRLNQSKVLPEFLSMALSGADYQNKMIFDAGGTTIKHIYISILAKMGFLLPGIDEQRNILEILALKLEKMDVLIESAGQASELLKERRTALISAAVTGKIDVRNWQAPEPADTRNKKAVA